MKAAPLKPLPQVGDRITLRFDNDKNPNNWKTSGLVRAIVDGDLVVRRWSRRWQCFQLHIITAYEWEIGSYVYVKRGGR